MLVTDRVIVAQVLHVVAMELHPHFEHICSFAGMFMHGHNHWRGLHNFQELSSQDHLVGVVLGTGTIKYTRIISGY